MATHWGWGGMKWCPGWAGLIQPFGWCFGRTRVNSAVTELGKEVKLEKDGERGRTDILQRGPREVGDQLERSWNDWHLRESCKGGWMHFPH